MGTSDDIEACADRITKLEKENASLRAQLERAKVFASDMSDAIEEEWGREEESFEERWNKKIVEGGGE
jgi:predicted RNase H-like nuclease (RuvC/YqgF family)